MILGFLEAKHPVIVLIIHFWLPMTNIAVLSLYTILGFLEDKHPVIVLIVYFWPPMTNVVVIHVDTH